MFTPIVTLVNIVIGAIEFFLGLRFLLRLLGANPASPFVQWIYDMTAPLLAPFENLFPSATLEGFVFDFTTLFALLVYVFAGYLLLQIIAYFTYAADRRLRG
jgi:uncharacterized protein YggT (Ycf19 family)